MCSPLPAFVSDALSPLLASPRMALARCHSSSHALCHIIALGYRDWPCLASHRPLLFVVLFVVCVSLMAPRACECLILSWTCLSSLRQLLEVCMFLSSRLSIVLVHVRWLVLHYVITLSASRVLRFAFVLMSYLCVVLSIARCLRRSFIFSLRLRLVALLFDVGYRFSLIVVVCDPIFAQLACLLYRR